MTHKGSVPPIHVFDWDGPRVSKTITVSGVVTKTFYVGNYYELTVSGGVTTTTEYYYFGSQRIAMKVGGGNYTYLHLDHLGSTNASSGATQSTGAVYFPYGNARAGNPPTDYTYTGQKIDSSDGLMYYGARYYDAQVGRFISADTIVPSAGNPQSLNRYAYALNNPLRYTDPSGHMETCGQGELCGDSESADYTIINQGPMRVMPENRVDPPGSKPLNPSARFGLSKVGFSGSTLIKIRIEAGTPRARSWLAMFHNPPAVTIGNTIYTDNPGFADPQTPTEWSILAHESTHVTQVGQQGAPLFDAEYGVEYVFEFAKELLVELFGQGVDPDRASRVAHDNVRVEAEANAVQSKVFDYFQQIQANGNPFTVFGK